MSYKNLQFKALNRSPDYNDVANGNCCHSGTCPAFGQTLTG